MPVYILHYETKLDDHAQHYLGYSSDPDKRIRMHAKGTGSHLTRAFLSRGIGFNAQVILPDGTRQDERRLKNQHNHKRFCPYCKGEITYDWLNSPY